MDQKSPPFQQSPQRRAADQDALIGGAVPRRGKREHIPFEWNGSPATYPLDRRLHEIFEDQAERTPDALALVYEEQRLTYRELNEKSNQLAHHLRKQSVGPDVLVGMYFERSLEMIIGLLGILKAGGAYVALDPALPRERLLYMLEDAQVAALVTRQCLAGSLPEVAPVICLDSEGPLRRESISNPAGEGSAENLVYVLYTSGSTGKPKGVAIEHRQLLNYLCGVRERLGLTAGASYASVSTLSADLGNTAVFSALAWGGSLHVISQERIYNGDALGSYFERHRIDCLKITPSHLAALQNIAEPSRVMPRRWLVLGGEAAPLRWVDELVKMAPGCAIFNHYGPTETSVGVLTFRVTPNRPETASNTLVLGRPLPNSSVFVVHPDLSAASPGQAGELLIGGAGLARGYLNRPELTEERFIHTPWGGRLYRSGDLCRYLPDGNIEFLGRIDDQVKIRGYRVELGEVESVLRTHPRVRACAVVARTDVRGDKRLLAYVTGDGLDPAELRSHLERDLPEYMLPSAFVRLEKLPLTPNGKVDRDALPEPGAPHVGGEGLSHTAPRDRFETSIAEAWCKLLGLERIGIDEDFFELGGHSLIAVRLFARIRREFGVDLPLQSLIAAPTVASLAALIREKKARHRRPVPHASRTDAPPHFSAARAWQHLVPLHPQGTRPPFFCVHGIGGDVLNLRGLAHAVGEEQPFYGVQARGVDGKQTPFSSIEEMAAAYLEEIQALQPRGPYYIGGYSGGGIIAFEMAQQLLARGHTLGMLALLDTIHPSMRSGTMPDRRERRRRHFDQLREQGIGYAVRWARGKFVLSKIKRRFGFYRRKLTIFVCEYFHLALPHDMRWVPLAKAQDRAVNRYEFRTLPARITLFAATEKPCGRDFGDPHIGWDGVAEGGLEVCEVPGNHLGMVDPPNVFALASELRARLEREQAGTPYPLRAGSAG